MVRKILQTKAQATTELALFGTIMLVILSVLLRYVIIFNAQQEAEMFAFRQALRESKLRHDSPFPLGDRKFAGASINIQKHVYPPDVFAAQGPQEATTVSASASVVVEAEAGMFSSENWWDNVLTKDDEPINKHYIIGPQNEIIDHFSPGYMVTLRVSHDNMPLTPWEGFKDMLNGHLNPSQFFFALEPVPYRDQIQTTTVTHDGQYQTQEHFEGSATYDDTSVTTIVTETRYLEPDVAQLVWEDWHMYGAQPIGGDMVVTDQQTFTTLREVTTPR